MISKESLAKIAAKAVRLIPGISSYQDKEELRNLDKRLRSHLVLTLDEERMRIEKVKSLLSKNLTFDFLDDLDALTRSVYRIADTIKFSAYGYSPLFEQGGVDEKRLNEVYQFDQSLEGELGRLTEQVDKLASSSQAELPAGISAVSVVLDALEQRFKGREEILKAVKQRP
jgi:hypothetical protein